MIENKTIPKPVLAVFEELKEQFEKTPEKHRNIFIKTKHKDISTTYHHSLGRSIRNTCGLWTKEGDVYEYFKSINFRHPDDVSSVIIDAFHIWIKNKKFNFDLLAEKYRKHCEEHWKKCEEMPSL